MNKQVYAAIALAVGLGLSGCGGGGGEAVPGATAVPLAKANYDGVAQEASASVADSDDIFNTTGRAFPLASADSSSVAQLASGQPDALARFALAQVKRTATGRAKAAAVETFTDACPSGGSLNIAANVANVDGSASVGDVITVTASNCVFDSSVPAINGVMSFSVRAVSLDGYGDMSSGTVAISFTNFSSADLVLNGAAVVSFSPTAAEMDFNGLSVVQGTQTRVYDFAVTQDSVGNVRVAGPIMVNGSTYMLATPTAFQQGAGHPVAGTLRITDGAGNRVDVVMADTSYTSSLYLVGDEVVDDSVTHNW